MIFGLVLAGGRSSRFGREKAVELFQGKPMIAWVAGALAQGTVRQAISAPLASASAAFAAKCGLPILPDIEPAPAGPLAGVVAGLRWAAANGATWLVTSPCDTPLMPLDLVARLTEVRASGGAVVRTAEGVQPLCALWPVSALAELEILKEHPPIRRVLQALGAVEVMFDDPTAFANLNTLQDFKAAEASPERES